ncbi:MAG: hypothetical protein WC979_08410 [Candidatus Pacearchaeota archaeon]|jgi:hypothetical protein
MKKIWIIAVIIIVLLSLGGFWYIKHLNSKELVLKELPRTPQSNTGTYEPIVITKENLPDFFKVQGFVQDFPSDGVVLVKLYSFESGERVYEESYVIKKGSVEKGSVENADITIILSSKYVPELGDFCGAVKKAKQNGDIGFETSMGKVALAWKYKGMTKYKDCFGL